MELNIWQHGNENGGLQNNCNQIVISGISGAFPKCDNLTELAEKLFNKEDLVTDIEEYPGSLGILKSHDLFDATFFGIRPSVANLYDPMGRMLLEKTYEAVIDAGYNPESLKGSNMGVFIGCYHSEAAMESFERLDNHGAMFTGNITTMLANGLSMWLDVHGPSYVVNCGCSASGYALHQACTSIMNGECDSAIVGGCNLCINPVASYQHLKMQVLSTTHRRCKSFDKEGDGYCRSETVCVVFLQKLKDARRVYTEIIHTKCSSKGFTETGSISPSGKMQKQLIDDFYKACRIPKRSVDWVEAHGTGTKAGDEAEINAIESLCDGRNIPLLVGSVKSNMGHSEAASMMSSIAKLVIAMESGFIPPNIHFNTPALALEALHGKIQVITEKLAWNGGLVAINNYGVGGSNFHGLFKSYGKRKQNLVLDDIPRLVNISGRTKEAVHTILSFLESKPIDIEMVALLHEIHSMNITHHLYRGYTILKKNIQHINNVTGDTRPLWFAFSGMGSQCNGIAEMMKIPVFADSIQKCHDALQTKGYNLKQTLHEHPADNQIVHLFVHISAVQIALVDLLKAINIIPDGIIGHSFGEIACGYCDGCLTLEEAILSSYYRGISAVGLNLPTGMMAVVGLGYDALLKKCPEEIDIACQNSPENCTISGPANIVKSFIENLKNENVTALELYTENVAYHSRYIKSVGPVLMDYLKTVIIHPKLRTERWVSTSIVQDDYRSELSKYCSAEYLVNNLLSPVSFKQTFECIPENAIVLEIAPHGGFLSIWKHYTSESLMFTSLMNKYASDNCIHLLSTLGKLYENGVDMKLSNLYPPVEFPVSKGTPMIAPLVRWDHSVNWNVPFSDLRKRNLIGERMFSISLHNENYKYLKGHVIEGMTLVPATAYIVFAWQTFAMMFGKDFRTVPVKFERIRFRKATHLFDDKTTILTVSVHKCSGQFEISENNVLVATGCIDLLNSPESRLNYISPTENDLENIDMELCTYDIYKEFGVRGYRYSGQFRGIISSDINGHHYRISWSDNWVTHLDNILQCAICGDHFRTLTIPEYIDKIIIDTKKHADLIKDQTSDSPGIYVFFNPRRKILRSSSVYVEGIQTSQIMRRRLPIDPRLTKYCFTPYINNNQMSLGDVSSALLFIVTDNIGSSKIKCAEIFRMSNNMSMPLSISIDAASKSSNFVVSSVVYTNDKLSTVKLPKNITLKGEQEIFYLQSNQGFHLVILSGGIRNTMILETVFTRMVMKNGFIAILDDEYAPIPKIPELSLCASYIAHGNRILLFRKVTPSYNGTKFVKIQAVDDFSWISELQKLMDNFPNERLVLVIERQPLNGILGFFKCIRKEIGSHNLRCLLIIDNEGLPAFSLDESVYEDQLSKELVINVYKNGTWGCYIHYSLEFELKRDVPHAFVVPNTDRGDQNVLTWVEGPLKSIKNGPEDDVVYVYYSTFNFKDVLILSRSLSTAPFSENDIYTSNIGFDFSGKLSDGRRVFGILPYGGAFSTLIPFKALRGFILDVPDEWSLEDAATVLVVYYTVLGGLIKKAQIKEGESILIENGTGGVGLAAINVAAYYNCNIFTTVGSQNKRDFIKKKYPFIEDSHIYNSKDESFDHLLLNETNDVGVDIVLNSYTGKMKQAALRCLSIKGRFVDLAKMTIPENPFGVSILLDEAAYYYLPLDEILKDLNRSEDYCTLIKEGINHGYVKPLERTVFDKNDAMKAYRYLSDGKHIGKVLLKIRDEEPSPVPPSIITKEAKLRFLCSDNSSFIIIGGLGGMGLEFTNWIINRGIRNVVLVSRSGVQTGYQKLRLHRWKLRGANVVVSTDDITEERGATEIIRIANKMGPVLGIVNSAMILNDMAFGMQSEETFETSFAAKGRATILLDHLSRTMCPKLKYFIVFSSIACSFGNTGQTNYGFANSVMERVCEKRKEEDYPALAIEWGGVGDVGALENVAEDTHILGSLLQPIRSCLEMMDNFMNQNQTIVTSTIFAQNTKKSDSGSLMNFIQSFVGLKNLNTIEHNTRLSELGLDSIARTELKQILEVTYDVFLTVSDIGTLTLLDLKKIDLGRPVEE